MLILLVECLGRGFFNSFTSLSDNVDLSVLFAYVKRVNYKLEQELGNNKGKRSFIYSIEFLNPGSFQINVFGNKLRCDSANLCDTFRLSTHGDRNPVFTPKSAHSQYLWNFKRLPLNRHLA